jgi:hypothetical protein
MNEDKLLELLGRLVETNQAMVKQNAEVLAFLERRRARLDDKTELETDACAYVKREREATGLGMAVSEWAGARIRDEARRVEAAARRSNENMNRPVGCAGEKGGAT